MKLIEEVASEIEEHFDALIDLARENQHPVGRECHDQEKERNERQRELVASLDELGLLDRITYPANQPSPNETLPKEWLVERSRDNGTVAEAWLTPEGYKHVELLQSEEQRDIEERATRRDRANSEISRLLGRVREADYPRTDPDTPRLMYELLGRITALYTNVEGRRRPLDSLLRYLRGTISHVWWLWSEWANACIVQGDFAVAEALLTTAWECPEFSKLAKGLHGRLVAARGVMYLLRDGDFDKALGYLTLARDKHAYEPACIALFRQLSYADRVGARELASKAIEPRALITQEWHHESYEEQLGQLVFDGDGGEDHLLIEAEDFGFGAVEDEGGAVKDGVVEAVDG